MVVIIAMLGLFRIEQGVEVGHVGAAMLDPAIALIFSSESSSVVKNCGADPGSA